MAWSLRIARVFGIDIKLHVTFPLILGLGAVQGGNRFGAALMALLFLCVTLHELGHGVVAQAFKIPVREIVLLPVGGVAMLGRNPDKPFQELLIAGAGPAVNAVIAAGLLLGTGFTAGLVGLGPQGLVAGHEATPSIATALIWLLEANVMLVLSSWSPCSSSSAPATRASLRRPRLCSTPCVSARPTTSTRSRSCPPTVRAGWSTISSPPTSGTSRCCRADACLVR